MNTKEYIASGILENYLLNNCSPQEQQEVECLSKIYPEIKQELNSLELALEKMALQHAKTPPPQLWDNILADIEKEVPAEHEEDKAPFTVVKNDSSAKRQEDKPNRNLTIWRVAASIAIVATTALVFSYYQTNNQLQEAYNQERNVVLQLEGRLQGMVADVAAQNKLLATIASPETQRVTLKGVEAKDPNNSALVMYNPLTREVYLNQGSLPANPSGKQYQLWALKDGQPIDLGVFDVADASAFIAMKGIDGAQAFAITLEDAGGKPTPNLEELYVIGELG